MDDLLSSLPAAGRSGKTKRLTASKMAPPGWFGWSGVAAMFLLMAARVPVDGEAWRFPLLSLGEWLLLPLGAVSLTMGLLTLWKIRERTLLPLWLSAILPALLWLAAAGLSIILSGGTSVGGDLFLSWVVHLVFPTLAFLPLVAQNQWRDRLMWALAAGVAVNALAVFAQAHASGRALPDPGLLEMGGLLSNQFDYALFLGLALPLLAAWRGGATVSKRALASLICTFLLPVLALAANYSWVGLAAAGIGLAISWIAWRSPAWVMGIFVCLLVFGYGGTSRSEQDAKLRRLLVVSASVGGDRYERALTVFEERPYFGCGPEAFLAGCGEQPGPCPMPWYASLLGGSGLAGLCLWLVLVAELTVRAVGRYGRPCLWRGGVLGATAALTVAGFWTDALPEGAGALVGLLLAVSVLEENEAVSQSGRRQAQRRRLRRVTAIIAKVTGGEGGRGKDNKNADKNVSA